MKTPTKALLLGAAHLAIVLAMGGKYLMDRATRPRVWMRAAPVDPNLPIRGRYVVLAVSVPVPGREVALDRMPREKWIELLDAGSARKPDKAPPNRAFRPEFLWDPTQPIPQLRLECRGSEAWGHLVQAPVGTAGLFRRNQRWNVPVTVGIDLDDTLTRNLGPEPPAGLQVADLDRWLDSLPPEQVSFGEPLAFFIPEKVADPSRRAPGEELWVEVTIPRKGPLRPIRLAVKTREKFTVLDL